MLPARPAKMITDAARGGCGCGIRAFLAISATGRATSTTRRAASRAAGRATIWAAGRAMSAIRRAATEAVLVCVHPVIGRACAAMIATAEAPGRVAQIGRLGAVDGQQVMQVFRTRPLVPSLVRGEQGLPEARRAAALVLVPGFDLLDDVGECRAARQPVSPDPGRAEDWLTLVVDGRRDRGGRGACHESLGSDPARNDGFFLHVTLRQGDPRHAGFPRVA